MYQPTEQIDLLTGLPNVNYFRRLSQRILDDAAEREKGLVFIYFDVNNFRAYNYRHGFDAGEHYLAQLGALIKKIFPELHVTRYSDDHFLAIAYNNDIDRRIEQVREQSVFDQTSKSLIIKAGIYIVSSDSNVSAVRACTNAKLACESIKYIHDILTCHYNEELGHWEKLRQHVIETLDEAIRKEYIRPYYQPIVHVLSGRLCGYEALARWEDPEFGFLYPSDFIKTLEDAHLIHRLDIFMIQKVCRDLKSARDLGHTLVPISVNLSAEDFRMADMPFIAEQSVIYNNLPNDLLNIEIMAEVFSSEYKSIRAVLDRFRAGGFGVWMDNFGSKHSSFNILEDVKVDMIKIDMKFLRDFRMNKRVRTILKNVINMSKELGIRTLMEGVEDEQVLEFLRQTGCEQAQGYFFGHPMKLEEFRYTDMKAETPLTRKYYNAIGRINLLSPTPLKSSRIMLAEQDHNIFNGIPIGVAEFDGRKFKFLMSNKNFCEIFRDLGVDGSESPEDVFNNRQQQFGVQIFNAAQQCIRDSIEVVQDFVTSEGFNNIRMRCVAFNPETNIGAILAIVEQVGANAALRRRQKKESALKFLYTLYSRVDLFSYDGREVENISLNSSRYRESFVPGDIAQSIENFAMRNIYSEDRQKFVEFFDLETIEKRVWESGGSYVIDYFRTRDDKHRYTWQMYLLIPVILSGMKYFLSCVRGIDAERMRRLPEIDRMGTEYYDMPGNPIFLLLASRAFASTFGYGSFEQFLNRSFYIEANLSANKVLYLHLGRQITVSQKIYDAVGYDEIIQDMILNTVVEEHHESVEVFFDRHRLLAAYEDGNLVGEMEFLRRPLMTSKPQYLHMAYQLRESNETGDVHVFFLAFNIDEYRRTREHITMLIERDNLTGLYNRGTAIRLISEQLKASIYQKSALVILDLDNFKQVNDRFGHDCGDMIIRDAATRMEAAFKQTGLIARIGGDEFLVLIKDQSVGEIDRLLRNFSDSVKEVHYHEHRLTYTMSIGYALYPDHGDEYNNLYQKADLALYSVKMSGRANFRCYAPTMGEANREQLGFSLAQLSEGMPGGFLVYRDNETQEILYANKKLMEIYECSTLEEFRRFTGNSFRGCVYEADWELVQLKIVNQLELSSGYDYVRYRARTAKGNIRLIEDFGRLVRTPDDGDIFYVFIIDLETKNFGRNDIAD